MALSAFDDKSGPPQERDFERTLGTTYGLWNELKSRWGQGSLPCPKNEDMPARTTGWGLRLKQEKHAILSMTPAEDTYRPPLPLGKKR